jgi:UDP-N-acetylmuramate dehydrogenase
VAWCGAFIRRFVLLDFNVDGESCFSHPISRYNSWGLGGKVKIFFKPKSWGGCLSFIKKLPISQRMIFLGLGSNILFPDGICDIAVVSTRHALNNIRLIEPGIIEAEAGVTCAKLAKFAAASGCSSGAFFAGIPGTVGGALAMNAGAFGSETWSFVEDVTMTNRLGVVCNYSPRDFDIGYRQVIGPNGFFIAARFKFIQDDKVLATDAIKALLKQRNTSQPIGTWNCGSVFKNPQGDYAAFSSILSCEIADEITTISTS